jgi:polar amino acid transport system permease protein
MFHRAKQVRTEASSTLSNSIQPLARQQSGESFYYARYFVDQTFNPFVAYPLVALYFIGLTLAIIGLFGLVNQRLNSHLPRAQRLRFRFRPQYVR